MAQISTTQCPVLGEIGGLGEQKQGIFEGIFFL